MTAPKFLVAKYAPDLHRMEPHNIGIIAWAEGQLAARFLGELPGGKVRPPHVVAPNSRDAYRQWIEFWRLQMSKPSLQLRGGGTVARDCPQFLDAMKAKSKPHFMLVEAGTFIEPVPAEELQAVVDELFGTLVEQPEARDRGQAEFELLRASAADFFVKTQLATRPDFRSHFPQVCRVHGILREIHFDNALGDIGRPLAVFQRVLLLKEQSVGNALHILEWYGRMPAAPPPARRYALVHAAAAQAADAAMTNISILSEVATVINVADIDEATRHFAFAPEGI